MELFDLNKQIFNKSNWDSVSNADKRKHFFMINRFMSIGNPLQAQVLQHIKINTAAVIDFWHSYMSVKYNGSVPGWIFTKGVKKSEEDKKKKTNIDKNVVREYCKFYKIDPKSAEDAILLFPDKFVEDLKAFEKLTKK